MHSEPGRLSMGINDLIQEVLRTPVGAVARQPSYEFDGLESDGSPKIGMSEQVLAETARATLVRCVPGVVFNDITAHRDEKGQLTRIEVDYMDELHDPTNRQTVVDFSGG